MTGSAINFLDKCYLDIESVEVFKHLIEDTETFALMADILLQAYEKFLGSDGRKFCESYLLDIRNLQTNCNVGDIKIVVLKNRKIFQESPLNNIYSGSFREENLIQAIQIAGPNHFTGTVVDVGCDDNMLGSLLRKQCLNVSRVIGVDIKPLGSANLDNKADFRLLPKSTELPLDSNEADTIIFRYVLHHIRLSEQSEIIDDSLRVLKPGGILIVIENTYSLDLPLLSYNDDNIHGFHRRMLGLNDPLRIRLLLAALDTFSQGIKRKLGPFPYTFRSIEEWREMFMQKEISSLETEYHGIPIYDLHQAPLGVFVLKK